MWVYVHMYMYMGRCVDVTDPPLHTCFLHLTLCVCIYICLHVCVCVYVCTLMRHYEPQTQISHNEPRTILPFVRTYVRTLIRQNDM